MDGTNDFPEFIQEQAARMIQQARADAPGYPDCWKYDLETLTEIFVLRLQSAYSAGFRRGVKHGRN